MDSRWSNSETLHPQPTSPPMEVIPEVDFTPKTIVTSPQFTHIDQRLTFYLKGVEVTHVLSCDLSPGWHTLRLSDVSPRLDTESLRVMLVSGEDRVLAVRVSSTSSVEPLAQTSQENSVQNKELIKTKEKLNRAHKLLSSWLDEIMKHQDLTVKDWCSGITLLENKITELSARLQQLNEGISSSPSIIHPDQELSQPEIMIELEVDGPSRYELEVSYVVPDAAWEPLYQVRLAEKDLDLVGTKPKLEASLNIEMASRFAQATDERWTRSAAEFCLFPPQRPDFPVLNYPAYQLIDMHGESPKEAVPLKQLLNHPSAMLLNLFADQATVNLTLELDLSLTSPHVEVIAQGKLDTLLPLAGGVFHRFIGVEWLGSDRRPPLVLGELLQFPFGGFSQIDVSLSSTPKRILIPQEPPEVSETEDNEEDASHQSDAGEDLSAAEAIELDVEELELSLFNEDDRVRTLLLSQPLSHGRLFSSDPERGPKRAPLGWVLSADRTRLMRWISLPPKRGETLTLLRDRNAVSLSKPT